MTAVDTPEDIIALLQNIEQRSKQKAAGFTSQEHVDGAWTAIGFRVGDHHFLIALDESREVFPVPDHVTAVPKAQPWVYGIVNLRGELLPVFDLKRYLQKDTTKSGKRSRIMVINAPSIVSSVLVDEVFGLKHFPKAAEAVANIENPKIAAYVTGSIVQQDTHWNVFSFQKLIADPRFINAAA